ncbi:hypothetical protein [Vibrio parahaemolyticus]|uniref:hypothetical protein n=1 Tax=Vibrio parahaemolyticus TaxID=670 RepID=UPI0027E4E40F|nr:hypothetical protein [Vibrio parahaemolyticus]
MNCYQRLGWARPYTTSFDQGLQFKELELILVQLESEPTSVKDPSRVAIQAMLALRSNWTQEAKRKYEKLYRFESDARGALCELSYNKLFKSDSARVAFLLCVRFGG